MRVFFDLLSGVFVPNMLKGDLYDLAKMIDHVVKIFSRRWAVGVDEDFLFDWILRVYVGSG
jgi:hypothetical protein